MNIKHTLRMTYRRVRGDLTCDECGRNIPWNTERLIFLQVGGKFTPKYYACDVDCIMPIGKRLAKKVGGTA